MFSSYYLLVSLLLGTTAVTAVLQESEYGEELDKLSKTLHSSCAAVTGIDDAAIEKMKTGDFPDDPTIKKYIKCLFISSTAMNESGEMDKKFIVNVMPEKHRAAVSQTVDKCLPKIKAVSDIDDKAYTFFKCVYAESPDIIPIF